MQFCGNKLDKKDFFGKSDPFLVFYRSNEDGTWVPPSPNLSPFDVWFTPSLHPEEIGFIDLPQIKSRAASLSVCELYGEVLRACSVHDWVRVRVFVSVRSSSMGSFFHPAVCDKSDKTWCSEGRRYQVHLPAKRLMKLLLCSLCVVLCVCVCVWGQ